MRDMHGDPIAVAARGTVGVAGARAVVRIGLEPDTAQAFRRAILQRLRAEAVSVRDTER
jgi:hypothetical protein